MPGLPAAYGRNDALGIAEAKTVQCRGGGFRHGVDAAEVKLQTIFRTAKSRGFGGITSAVADPGVTPSILAQAQSDGVYVANGWNLLPWLTPFEIGDYFYSFSTPNDVAGAYALAKGTMWLQQIRRLSRPSQGMPHKFIRKLFISVCLPKMLYGCDVFCAFKIANPDAKSGLIPRMARVQRAAALQITGALKSSPNDSLNIHADLEPLQHTIRKFCYRAALRMSSPTSSPGPTSSPPGRLPHRPRIFPFEG